MGEQKGQTVQYGQRERRGRRGRLGRLGKRGPLGRLGRLGAPGRHDSGRCVAFFLPLHVALKGPRRMAG